MKKRLLRMAILGATRWAGNRAGRSQVPLLRAVGTGLAASAWAVPLGVYAVRRLRGR